MENIKIYDLKKPGTYSTINYDNGSVLLEDIIEKFNPRLNFKNSNLAIGNKVFLKWDIPIDACLFYGDTISLYSDEKKKNTIECDSGGFFADLTEGKSLKWNKDAPKYRIASKGLCLEGKCKNSECSAYDKMAVINMGAPVIFKLGLPTTKQPTNCPLCKKHVKAVTCGFNNCEYKYLAMIETDNGLEPKESEWQEVKDVYYRFDENKSLNYTSLVIETRIGNNSLTREFVCGICLSSKQYSNSFELYPNLNSLQKPNNSIKELSCKHTFHEDCINAWLTERQTCPYCRKNVK